MALNTWLHMVSESEVAALKENPARISRMDEPDNECCSTYYLCTINYFLTGDAYPSGQRVIPLTCFLSGLETVDCDALEIGCFHLLPADLTAAIVAALEAIDLGELRAAVAAADADDLMDADVDDFEILIDGAEDPGQTLVADVEALLAFYRAASDRGLGVVIYTS